MSQPPKILITGASGFVGSFLVEEALSRGLEVHAGIRRTSSRQYLQDERLHFALLDFEDEAGLQALCRREAFDLVIHNAGLVTAPSREAYFRVNTEYTRRLWAACLTAPTPPRKFLFISSLAAWGPATDDPADRISLTTPPNPITAYGESKLAAERFLMEDAGLPYLIFRPTVVYGPRERDLFTFFKMVKRGLQPVVGFGPQYLSFVFVRDLVRLVLDGALSSLENRAYFVADGQTYSPEELGRLTREILQVRALSFRVPIGVVSLAGMLSEWLARRARRYPILNRDKVAELKARNWQCDIQPLVQDFGFQPRYTLQEGLQITLDWYRQQGWL